MAFAGPSSDMNAFRKIFAKAKNIVVLTGTGISIESGVPTFKGVGGFWKKHPMQLLATPAFFEANPSLVWEFYSYRREVVHSKSPNPAHEAIAQLEKRLKPQGRSVVVVTISVDGLHKRAGSENVIEFHGT